VRQIVKLSGGRLGVRSKLGEGSTFWVELRTYMAYRAGSSAHPLAALGVGSKTAISVGPPVPGNAEPTTQLEQMFDVPAMPRPPDSKDIMTESTVFHRSPSTRTRPSSALHSIMDQGASGCRPKIIYSFGA
jgi:osomolarity two-component system sensor histidine kinase SLN1